MPLVSVCIPAYNHEKYIERTIRSIINQTYQRMELVIIDDGSKDRTWDVIQKLKGECEERFERTVLQTQQNRGTCITLNSLFALAGGEFVYLIASDDEALPNAMETLVNAMQSGDYVLAVGDDYIIDEDGNRVSWGEDRSVLPFAEGRFKTFFSAADPCRCNPNKDFVFGSYESFLRGNYVPNGYLIRTSAIRSIRPFTKDAPLEDYYMHLQLSKIGRYVFVNEPLFNYRWHVNNTMRNLRHIRDMFRKTYMHERNRLIADKDWYHLKMMERKDCCIRIKTLLRMGRFFELRKESDFDSKRKVLQILDRVFLLTERKRELDNNWF